MVSPKYTICISIYKFEIPIKRSSQIVVFEILCMSYFKKSLEAFKEETQDSEVAIDVRTRDLSPKRRYISSIIPYRSKMRDSSHKQYMFGRNWSQ